MGQLVIFLTICFTLVNAPAAFGQDAGDAPVDPCQSRLQSLQDLQAQNTVGVTPECLTELNDATAEESTTKCFSDPLQSAPTVTKSSGNTGGIGAAAQTQAAAYRLADSRNQTQSNNCWLHYNRVKASCSETQAAPALKALKEFASCSENRSAVARGMASQTATVAGGAATGASNQQVAGLSGVAMGCYLLTCTISGGLGTVSDTAKPLQPLKPSLEDVELTGRTTPKPQGAGQINQPYP